MASQFVSSAGPQVSVSFKGGKLPEFVDALRSATSEPVNIALQGEAAGIQVEPMELRNVSVGAALHAALGGGVGRITTEPDGTQSQVMLRSIDSPDGTSAPVYSVSREIMGRARPRTERMVDVYSIQSLLQGGGAKDQTTRVVLTAIESAVNLAQEEGEPQPEIKYHQDSGLLLVRGTGPQLALVGQVVKRMISDQEQRAAIESQRRMRSIDRRAGLQKAEIRARLADSQYGRMADELKRAQAEVAKGGQKQDVTVEFMDALERAKAERDMAHIDVERLGQEAELPDLAPAPAADDSSELLIQTLKTRIEQLEKELAALKDKPAAKPGSREE
jgi:hypothetical protein